MVMLSALATNPDYWRPKLNVAIFLAPVHTMHRCNAKEPHKIKDSVVFAKSLVASTTIGEMQPEPQGQGRIASNLLELTGLSHLGISTASDSNLEHLNRNAIPNFMANMPVGTSLKNLDHFRQILAIQKF
jgi:hypothetical protein